MPKSDLRKNILIKFTDLGLTETLLRAVSAGGYTVPTPIQGKVIPAMMKGEDLIGIAQTGTGKTASFVLPLLDKISQETRRPKPKRSDALILTPTRELATQICDNIKRYGQFMHHSTTVVVGGAKPGPQIKAMSQGTNILVATPGRLEDHMASGAIRLDETMTIVLDEADQMLDLGFMPAIRRIMAKLPKRRQTVLMSATMPKQIRSLAQDFLRNPSEIAVAPASKPIDRIAQTAMHVAKVDKRQALIDILKRDAIERAIVFTRTKHGANKVTQHLEKAGLAAAAIHGNKSQSQRERTLAAFRAGTVQTLVATDIAARGIDVEGISHVINFDLPNVPEVYVHRIGRTARAGKSGVAISLCDEAEFSLLRDIEKLIGHSFGIAGAVAGKKVGSAKAGRPEKRSVASGNGKSLQKRSPNRKRKKEAAARNRKGTFSAHTEPSAAGLSRMLGNIHQSQIINAAPTAR